jgi:predicted small lipoprotein YifL
MHRFACLAALCLALTACGLKGDLYLPPEPATVPGAGGQPAQPDPASEPADDDAARRQLPAPPDRGEAQ